MPTGRKGKRTALLYPDCHIEVSMISSNSEVINGWNKEDNVQNEEATDQYSSHYSLAHTSQTDLNTFMKPTKQRFSCPVDTRMSPRCLLKPTPGNTALPNTTPEGRQWPGLKPSKPWTLPEGRRPAFDFPPLPIGTVPQADTPRNLDNLVQLSSSKYYVLEPNLEHSPTKTNSDSSGDGECSIRLPPPKYYVLEPNSDSPQSIQSIDYAEKVEHSVPLPLPKYYVLEPDTQDQTKILHMQTQGYTA